MDSAIQLLNNWGQILHKVGGGRVGGGDMGGTLEGSLGVSDPPRSSNPDPVKDKIRSLFYPVLDKRLFFMTQFKIIAQMPPSSRYFLFR